jgi:hypothetical protein
VETGNVEIVLDQIDALPRSMLGVHSMPTQTVTTRTVRDAIPPGSDFVGGAEALPERPTPPGPAVPGSDFAGGTSPLTDEGEHGEPGEEPSTSHRSHLRGRAAP